MKTDYESLKSQYAAKGDDYFEQDRREMLEFIPPDAETILDVGCGSGTFGQLVKQEINCIYWGIEPDAASAEKAALRLDKVINSTFPPICRKLKINLSMLSVLTTCWNT